MNIEILSRDGDKRIVTLSKAMEKHFSIPINHANTILNQINSGMYKKWFEGKKDLVCIDFGANVGIVSLYMLPFCRKLLCVEPTPSHYDLLLELMLSNDSSGTSTLIRYALTGEEGEFRFATGHSTENKVTSEDGYGNHKIQVTGKPLSWFVNEVGEVVDFCKCDIEGGEMIAITVDELKKVYGKVKTFFVECHPAFNGGMDSNREELISRFEQAGYKTETIDYQTIVAYAS